MTRLVVGALVAAALLTGALPAGATHVDDALAFSDARGVGVVDPDADAAPSPLPLPPADGGQQDDGRRVSGAFATWSPDGRHLAYTAPREDPSRRLFVVDRDLQNPRDLGPGDDPDWSPHGDQIAFVAPVDDGRAIFVIAPDGSGRRQVSRAAEWVARPRWSPQGTELLHERSDEPGEGALVVTRLDGSERVLHGRSSFGGYAWAPDGGAVVASVAGDGGGFDASMLLLLGTDGATLRDLGDGFRPAFSPDGTTIAYATRHYDPGRDGQERAGIWVVNVDGSGRRKLAQVGSEDDEPAWSPDGRRVAFAGQTSDSGDHELPGAVHVVDVDGSDLRQVTRDSWAVRRPTFAPGIVRRVHGETRVETAVRASQTAFATADAAVLARADTYPDALAGAPLAGTLGGPLLLTPGDALHPAVAEELRRLGVRRVVLLGNGNAVDERVVHKLRDMGIAVERIGGVDRFWTAASVAERVDAREVYLVEGMHADPARGWPDAVSVSALAAHTGRPILLVTAQTLPAGTAEALRRLDIERATIIGGQAAVSEAVADEVRQTGIRVERVAGSNRYETSQQVARRAVAAGLDANDVWTPTGRGFPDALAAGPAAAQMRAPLLLVDGRDSSAGTATQEWIREVTPERVFVVGGPDTVTPPVAVMLERRAREH